MIIVVVPIWKWANAKSKDWQINCRWVPCVVYFGFVGLSNTMHNKFCTTKVLIWVKSRWGSKHVKAMKIKKVAEARRLQLYHTYMADIIHVKQWHIISGGPEDTFHKTKQELCMSTSHHPSRQTHSSNWCSNLEYLKICHKQPLKFMNG